MSVIETALAAGERVASLLGVPWGGRKRLPEADSLLLLAYGMYKSDTCASCGGLMSECTDPAHEWEVDASRICRRTVALREWEQQQGENRSPGLLPAVVKIDRDRAQSSQAALVAALEASAARA